MPGRRLASDGMTVAQRQRFLTSHIDMAVRRFRWGWTAAQVGRAMGISAAGATALAEHGEQMLRLPSAEDLAEEAAVYARHGMNRDVLDVMEQDIRRGQVHRLVEDMNGHRFYRHSFKRWERANRRERRLPVWVGHAE